MNTPDLNTQALKALIKESIHDSLREVLREILREERLLLYQTLIPSIHENEQAEIEAEIGRPDDYADEDWIDLTAWVTHGSQISEISD